MTVVRCPRCRDDVTVPLQASGSALVRCPLCLEQYLLSEALAQAPPALIMVSENVRDGFAAPAVEVGPEFAGDEYLLADGGVATSPLVTTAGRDAAIAAAGLSFNRRPRSAQRERHFVWEMAKVALGGIAGLFLGMIVLWWLFRTDPLELGPSVARYTPWIVPSSLQGRRNQPQIVVQASSKPSSTMPATENAEPPPPSGITIRESSQENEDRPDAMPDLTDLLEDSPVEAKASP